MRTLATLSLALGIGLTAALSSIVDAILLRPLPVARADEVVRVFTSSESQPLGFVSYPDYEDFRKAMPMTAECLIPVTVGEPPQSKLALAVTADYFDVLGVPARFGRTFTNDEGAVAMLAHGDFHDLGKNLRVGTQFYTVIGIAPENFGLDRFLHADLYIPIRSYGDGKILADRSRRFLTVHARGSGTQLVNIAARLEQQHPDTNRGRRAVVLDERTARLRTDKMMAPLARLLGTLAALILTIGCLNASGALLIRAEARLRERALKMALGAGRIRLMRESLQHAGGIALTGCALAVPLAWMLKEDLLRSLVLPTDFGISVDARIDGRVLLLCAGAAVFATIVCGAAPSCLRINVWATLKAQERSSKSRTRLVLAGVEITLAAALISTGGTLWNGLNAARQTDLGYRTKNIWVMTFDPAQIGYNETRTRTFYRDLIGRVKALPGVAGVALAQSVPLAMTGVQKQIRIGDQEEMTVWMNIVTPEYFTRLHIPMVDGRNFDDREAGVAIVNEELARRIGTGGKMKVAGRDVKVIGVVKTAKYMRWDERPRPYFYLPYGQNYVSRMTLHVESGTNILPLVRKMARDVPMSEARSLREYFDNGAMYGVKAALRIAAIAGGGGLLLALAGLYCVVSSTGTRRRREIGIRISLGARHASVLAMIVRQGLGIATLGTAAGVVAAHYGSRVLQGFVPAATESVGPAALVLAASVVACAIPAVRALRVDPAVVLREE